MLVHGKDDRRNERMKYKHSKIGEYRIRLEPIEGYKTKNGKKVLPHYKKRKFNWHNDN